MSVRTFSIPGRAKYSNRKVEIDGIRFDSAKEAKVYQDLMSLKQVGEIKGFDRQVKYELVPTQRRDGKIVERPVYYVADFVIHENDGTTTVVDVKSPATRTPAYVIKRKLMLHQHNIQIVEV